MTSIEDATGAVHLEERRRIQIGSNSKRHVHIPFGEGFHFPRPGYYRFVLSFDGDTIGEQIITIQ